MDKQVPLTGISTSISGDCGDFILYTFASTFVLRAHTTASSTTYIFVIIEYNKEDDWNYYSYGSWCGAYYSENGD
jgi:hypothetical protein